MVSAGFRFDGVSRFPILNLQWDDDAYSNGLAGLFQDFVGRKKELPYEDLKRSGAMSFTCWAKPVRTFFSSNRYIFRACNPDR
jgi:hypothetical protein